MSLEIGVHSRVWVRHEYGVRLRGTVREISDNGIVESEVLYGVQVDGDSVVTWYTREEIELI